MKILLINPNSSDLVTDCLKKAIDRYAREDITVDVIKNPEAPSGIVTNYEELMAGTYVVNEMKKKESNYDAMITGCFSDPGLFAAREVINKPITGLFESCLIYSKLLGKRFSIVASGDYRDITFWYGTVRTYGEIENLASIHYMDSTVENTVLLKDEEILKIVEKCKYEDGADVVILGCAAFAGRAEKLSSLSKIPVLDGIKESILLAEMLSKY